MVRRIRNLIRVLIFVLCVMLINSSVLNAEENPTIFLTSDYEKITSGSAFSVKVELTNNIEGIISTKLMLTYDISVMELTGYERTEVLRDLSLMTTNVDTKNGYKVLPFVFLFDGQNPDYSNGTFLILHFKTYENVSDGVYDINLDYDSDNTNSDYKSPLELEVQNTAITINSLEDFTITPVTSITSVPTLTVVTTSLLPAEPVIDFEYETKLPFILLFCALFIILFYIILIIIKRIMRK